MTCIAWGYGWGLLHTVVGRQRALCWLGRHSLRAALFRDTSVASGREAGGSHHYTRMLAAVVICISPEDMQAQCLCRACPLQQVQPLFMLSRSICLAAGTKSPTHQQAQHWLL